MMDNRELILSLYKKGCTPKYIANLMFKKMKKINSAATQKQVLNLVESIILEFYTSQRA